MNEHITKKSFEELNALAKPLQDWMMDNFNPHTKIEITTDGVAVLTTTMYSPMEANID